MAASKEWRAFIRELEAAGWQYVSTNKHIKFRHPRYGILVMPQSTSDRRALLNARATVRRIMTRSDPKMNGR